jgi:hypothetical protein
MGQVSVSRRLPIRSLMSQAFHTRGMLLAGPRFRLVVLQLGRRELTLPPRQLSLPSERWPEDRWNGLKRHHLSRREEAAPAAGPDTGRCGDGTSADDRGSAGCILICLPPLRLEPPCSAHPRDARHAHSRICGRVPS